MPDTGTVFVHIVPNATWEQRIIQINKPVPTLTYKLDMLHSPDLQLSEAQDVCLFLH